MAFRMREPLRVEVDPNSISRVDPTLSVVARGRVPAGLDEGAIVTAVQPNVDGSEGRAPGYVIRITENAAYIRVDWSRHVETPSPRAIQQEIHVSLPSTSNKFRPAVTWAPRFPAHVRADAWTVTDSMSATA